MRIFKKPFARFAGKQGIDDAALAEAVRRAEQGIVDADLGGGVIKQRIARKGQGKSGGYRSILLFRARQRGLLRLRLRQERPQQHSRRRTRRVPPAGGGAAGARRGGDRQGHGERND